MATTPTDIAQLWRRVNRHLRDLMRAAAGDSCLPPLTLPVLHRIESHPGITVSELARQVGTVKSHVSKLIDQFSKDGYVEKHSDPADQRVIRLYLTAAGARLIQEHHERAHAIWAMVLRELPESDLEQLGSFLQTLCAAFERAAGVRSDPEAVHSPTIGVTPR